ncbi:hypothetical protein ACHAW5_000395 [Stephanodiscus triporus]|uniref:DUF6824 domain-containing protein n=1 Tax=Stephanodiscus triporus TaxID=2934178 RepID=A0ABD3QID6_9STRA
MIKRPSYSSVQIGDASKSLMSSQDRFRMCPNRVDGSASADTSQHDQWELLMTQVRDQLHSANSNVFDSRAVELRKLASSEAGIRSSRNLCDPPVLVSAPGYPYYATSSFVQVSPIRPSSKEPNADMESMFPGQVLAEEVSSVSSSVRPRFGSLLHPIQRLTPHFGSGALPYAQINSDMEYMCTHSSPGQILAEEILSTSSTQMSSHRQISYAASDDHTPSQCDVFGASQATDTDLQNEIRVESVLADIPGSNSALKAKTTKTKQVAPNGRSKKNFIGFTTPKELDVLAGRGGETNRHMGNLMFREEARKLRVFYRMKGTSRDEKFALSLDLVETIQKNGGRFLGKCDGLWYVMNDDDARKKAIQALRENKWS